VKIPQRSSKSAAPMAVTLKPLCLHLMQENFFLY